MRPRWDRFSGLVMYDGTSISGCNAPSVEAGLHDLTVEHGLDTVVVENVIVRPVFDAVSVITPGVSDALQILGSYHFFFFGIYFVCVR